MNFLAGGTLIILPCGNFPCTPASEYRPGLRLIHLHNLSSIEEGTGRERGRDEAALLAAREYAETLPKATK